MTNVIAINSSPRGVATTVMPRAGATTALNTMINLMAFSDMVIPGRPVIGIGNEIGAVRQDEEGIMCAHDTGKNMVWLLNALSNRRE